MRIKEFADLSGVSIRTLHYYDEIGLLKPTEVDQCSGYRYYDEGSLLRIQDILFYRELDFSLKNIREILTSPDYDKQKALKEQKALLQLKKERLERLISAVDGAMKGENVMAAFDNSTFEKHKAEVKEKWGATPAYAEYTEKRKTHTEKAKQDLTAGMETLLSKFALCMQSGAAPDSLSVQELVEKLQNYITEHFYTCTKPILAGLGKMYIADERFQSNIDRHAAGTAEFISQAISIYCSE